MLFEGQICCHSTGLQVGREEYINPEGGKTTIVAHMWLWQGLYREIVGCFFDFHYIRESPK